MQPNSILHAVPTRINDRRGYSRGTGIIQVDMDRILVGNCRSISGGIIRHGCVRNLQCNDRKGILRDEGYGTLPDGRNGIIRDDRKGISGHGRNGVLADGRRRVVRFFEGVISIQGLMLKHTYAPTYISHG